MANSRCNILARPIVWAAIFALLLSGGCRGLEAGKTEWLRVYSDLPRAGNVYLIRGLIGVFSTGMDDLAVKLNDHGVRAHVFQDAQNSVLAGAIAERYREAPDAEPLCLIGHSYGADGVVRVARRLEEKGIKVNLLITLDPTTPPSVPKSAERVYNFYQPQATDFIPLFRGVPLKQDPGATGTLQNYNLRKERLDLLDPGTNHINIDKSPKVHQAVIQIVLEVCPERKDWLARQNGSRRPSQSPGGSGATGAPTGR